MSTLFFFSPFTQILGYYLKIDHDRFIPYTLSKSFIEGPSANLSGDLLALDRKLGSRIAGEDKEDFSYHFLC
jgi:hypothetical protein